ncbi:MAG: hypothetical protein KME29_09525 [Calothrix sp. FI2-JRJ7]|jgi:hypothetical protein|nr:hypothetical protein [Calothrix sp. FI2-JRJ7]
MNIDLISSPPTSNKEGAVHQINITLSLAEALVTDLIEGEDWQITCQTNPSNDLGTSLNDTLNLIRYVL